MTNSAMELCKQNGRYGAVSGKHDHRWLHLPAFRINPGVIHKDTNLIAQVSHEIAIDTYVDYAIG